MPSWGQSGRCCQEDPSKQWALRETAGLARSTSRVEARPWADGKAAGGFRGFSKGSGLASGHTCLYGSFSAQRTGKASQEIGQDPRKWYSLPTLPRGSSNELSLPCRGRKGSWETCGWKQRVLPSRCHPDSQGKDPAVEPVVRSG